VCMRVDPSLSLNAPRVPPRNFALVRSSAFGGATRSADRKQSRKDAGDYWRLLPFRSMRILVEDLEFRKRVKSREIAPSNKQIAETTQ